MSSVNLPGVDKPIQTVAILDGSTGEMGTIPPDLLTDGGNGPNRRLRVDVAQTGFFAGREFRTWKELNLTLGQEYVVKAVVPKDIILFANVLQLVTGEVKMYTSIGGTAGGTLTGETNIDLVWVKTADNSNFSGNVGGSLGEERGVAANTYHFKLTAVAAATGIWSAWWEERV